MYSYHKARGLKTHFRSDCIIVVAVVVVTPPYCHCRGCSCHMVMVVIPSCHCHCYSCIIFAVISAIVVGPWLEKAKCSWCKSSIFGNGYQVQLFRVWTMQLVSKSKLCHFRGMFSFFPPCQAMHSQPLPQLVPPLPHKWHTCTHTMCCLMVIALDLPCQPPSRGPYHSPEATLLSST